MVSTDEKKIQQLLTRGVEQILVKENLEAKLRSGKQLRIKFGIDPTGSNIHIGRAVVLRKLKEFQDLGHLIVLIVGDFTAQIGDPSDKLAKRPMLDRAAILANLENYKEQVGKIIDLEKAEYHFNSEWLQDLNFQQVAELAETFSVQQMLSRRNFKDRHDKGEEISLREFLYPLMQGYDSVIVRADIEIGGFDQLFNIKAGRTIQKHFNLPEQDVMATTMLEGTDGRKMSTSWGNVINITDEPNDMFGKIMAVNDSLIEKYFLLTTDALLEEVNSIKQRLESGENPRDIKMELGMKLVALYHSEEQSQKAKQNFIEAFQKGGVPEDILSVTVSGETELSEILLDEKLVASKTEFRRLIDEGAIKNMENEEVIDDPKYIIKQSATFKVGKRRFIKINFS